MLYLISLGIHDEKDMSLRALEVAKSCDLIYLELYTNKMDVSRQKLEKVIDKKIITLNRKGFEEYSDKIISEARNMNIGILVGGDALSATTHISLLLDAKKAGIKTKVIHGSSIFIAVAETGLMMYKFGRACTLCFPEGNVSSEGVYETVSDNLKSGLHSLILLDIKSEEDRFMDIPTGLKILLKIEKEKKNEIVSDTTKIVSACNLGGDETIIYSTMREAINNKRLKGNTPAVVVIPGKLHFLEEEYLGLLK